MGDIITIILAALVAAGCFFGLKRLAHSVMHGECNCNSGCSGCKSKCAANSEKE